MASLAPCRSNRLARLVAAAATATALLALPAPAHAAGTLHVDDDSLAPAASCGAATAPCASLADALAHATGGELIFVAAGNYTGATITEPVHLQSLPTGSARIHGTLIVQADSRIEGFDFNGITGPAIRVTAPLPERGRGATAIVDNAFSDVDAAQVIRADAALEGLTITGNSFTAGSAARDAAIFVHGTLAGDASGVVVERNEFRGFSGAAIDAGGTPGLSVRGNDLRDCGSLLTLSDSDASTDPIDVRDNDAAGLSGPAVRIGRGVRAVTITRNRLASGTQEALRLEGLRGTGPTTDVRLTGNDIEGFAGAVSVTGTHVAGTIVVRGNRLVDAQRSGAAAIDNDSSGGVDARRNWWGSNAGAAARALSGGGIDVSDPLRLVGVEAPSAVFVGGSGVVTARLESTGGGPADADASGFSVSFATTSGTLDALTVPVRSGRASTYFTAGPEPGPLTSTATLDGEQVRATTQVLAPGAPPAQPGAAESRPAGSGPPRLSARMLVLGRLLARAPSAGFHQVVTTNRAASVRTTYVISHYDARRLGLRPRSNRTHQPFVIARVRTRAISGRRVVIARLNPRPAWAIRRANLRIAVTVITTVRTEDGDQRSGYRRIVIPANAR